jgi:HECT-domain (ubiquitin-transferase)
MSGALQRNITGTRAQILSLSGGGVHSSHLIEMNAQRCSVLPLARLGFPWADSMICKVYKAPSAFPFIEHMVTPTGFLRLILVCRLKALLEARLIFDLPGFNQIDLPQYSSYEMLRQQLLLSINEGGEGFGFA